MSGVLLVDDEPRVTDALKRSLRNEAFTIYCASSANEALEILARNPIDVVVSDEMMPGMHGTDFLGLVCTSYPETVRIILTGHPDLNTALKAINKGHIYMFLVKPCSGVELALIIRQGLQHRDLLRNSARLLKASRTQSRILERLERQHPGITRLDTDAEGTIEIPDSSFDPDQLLKEIESEIKKLVGSESG